MYAKYFYLLQNVEHFIPVRFIRITPFKIIKFQNADIELYLSI